MSGLKLSMKLSQQLRMTPQLQQAIKMLQLTRIELQTTVRKELEENPVLEEYQDTVENDAANETEGSPDEIQPVDASTAEQQDPTKQDEMDWESYLDSNSKPLPSYSGGSEEIMNYENIISTTKSLKDHLDWQASLAGFNEEEEYHAQLIIDQINDDGYISMPLEEIAATEDGVTAKDLEEMLPFIHEFDPAGVGSRNLKECLLLQAKHLQEDTHDLVNIINNHLPDLEKRNYPAISKTMKLDLQIVIELCDIITSMDPKPGRVFSTSDVHYISPDVYVHKAGDEYLVSLNEEGLPRLRVSNLYKQLLKEKKTEGSKETQDYVQDKLRSAVWLIKSIQQRQRTIYRVTESIVKFQREFFDHGPQHIKPMILRDIAEDIEMHESTVSRVTTNKYVHTPQGIFELKYFFNSGISTADGDSMASASVKLKIKELVANEDPKKPLSDQKLVDLLKKDGIKIARRTIAKYRDALKILPSSKRKKYF